MPFPFPSGPPLWVAAVGGDARGGRVAESVKGGTPVPPAAGSGRLVVPAPQRPLLPGGCGGLTWWGEFERSWRAEPAPWRLAKTPCERGLSVSCPARCCRCFASVFLGPHPEARRSFRAATTSNRARGEGRRPSLWALTASAQECPVSLRCRGPFSPAPGPGGPGKKRLLFGGSRWGDELGGGRRALGEKAFSSDPRGCLGVPEPPSRCPSCARSGHLCQGDCMPLCVLGGAFSPA